MSVQFYTDPGQYNPPADGQGALLFTASKPSQQNVGRQIPDTIIGQVVRTERITLTAAQLKAAFGATADVTVVPQTVFTPSGTQGKPGPGLAYRVHSLALRYNFKTTDYTINGGTLKLYHGPSANAIPLTADLSAILTQGHNADNIDIALLATGVQTQANIENQPIVISVGTASFTLGDGTLDVIVEYTVVQM